MDSSPRPQRRFSRWQTTKRTFVLAGVAYKPTDVNTILQNGNEKSDSVRKTKKVNYDKNDNNHKNILNHSTNDSVTKRRQHTPPLVAKPSAARRLCLDTSRRKDSKTKVIHPTKTPPAQEAVDDTVWNDRLTTKDASVPQSTGVATTEKCENSVKVDPPLLQEFHLQLERVDLRIHDIGEDAVQQNNKCALSNISQNKSASQPSQSVPEDKSSAVHTLPSQKKANVALDCATEEVPEAGVFTNEANKRKRQAADDDKSSDSSSTDKENVEKDSANISVPSQSKKLKKDGILHNMPSATRNVTFEDLNVSQRNKYDKKISQAVELSARRSSLRNRSLLASPETLMKKRQCPVFHVAEKKNVPEKNVTVVNNVSCVEMGSSVNRKTPKHILLRELELSKGKNTSRDTINKTPLTELELSKEKDTSIMNSGSSFNRRTTGRMGSSELEVSKAKDTSSVNIGSKKDQSKKESTIKSVPKKNSARQKNQNKDKSVNSSRYDVITPTDSKSVHSVHSDNTESLIVKNGLRDRRTLPTPEEIQQQRRYPNNFSLTNRRSSIGKSYSDSKRDFVVKQQGKSIQDRDACSQLEQTEPSSASAKKNKGKNLRNTNGTCAVSNSRPQRKKCSTTLQHSPHSSHETVEQPTQQGEADKLLEHTDKNHKNILNHSTNDSVTKRRQHTPPLVAKPSAARRLCLDTSRRKNSKTKVIDPTKTPPAQEAVDDTVFNNRLTSRDASVPQSTSVATTEKCENSVKVDPPLLQEFHLQLERVDLRIHDIGEDAVQQNNKCAVSNISQNKSASQPSQSVPEDKSSAVHTLPSQKKANVALDCATEEVPEAGVFTNEAKKRKRQAADDDKSSDSSSTDKENVEKDSANISVPSQSKKLKKDGVLHNMPSAARNVTFEDLNVSQKNKHDKKISQAVKLSARRSSLRNRSLLASPETLMKKRQCPVYHVAEKKNVPEKNVPVVNNVSCVEMGSSVNRKTPKHILLRELELSKGKNTSRDTINKTPLPELELSKEKDTSIMNSGSSFNGRTTGWMGSSELEVSKAKDTSSVNIRSKKDQSKKESTIKSVPKKNSARQKNQNKDKSVNSSRYDVITPTDSKSVHSVHSDNTESLIVKNGLRDRRTLPTPEEIQQQRRHPNNFSLTNRRSSIGKSYSDSKRDFVVKQQGKSIQDRDACSQLEQTEPSLASAKKNKGKSLRNTNDACAVSNSRPQRKKCSTSLQHSPLSSHETAEQPTQQGEADKLLEHTGNISIDLPAGAKHMGLSAITNISTSFVEKEKDRLSAHSVHSEDIDSSSVKSSLRDRLLLPTPEDVRQYRSKSFLTSSRSTVGKSGSDSKHDVSIKKQQKKVQNREATSQLGQIEPSSASAQKITQGKSRNKNGTHVTSSKRQPGRKKCSSPLQYSPLSSHEISEQPTEQRATEKVLKHTHNVAIEQPVGAENIGLSAKSRINENSVVKTKGSNIHGVRSEDTDSFCVKSGLRDRHMLPTPEEVQQQRQYPIEFLLNNRSSSIFRSDSNSKHNVSVMRQQKAVQNREAISQSEHTEPSSTSPKIVKVKSLTSSKNGKHTTSKRHPDSKTSLSPLHYYSLSSHETSMQPTQQRKTVKTLESTHNKSIEKPVNTENIEVRTKNRIGDNHAEKKTDSLSAHSVHSDSFSVKSGLRDRRTLPTPEEVQRQRQCPVKSFLTNRSYLEKLDSESQQNVSGKKQRKKPVQNREPSSQLEQSEHSSMSSKIIKEKSVKRTKNETHGDSKSRPERKKCVLPLQHVSTNSSETLEQPANETLEQLSSQAESSHNVLTKKPVGADNIGVSGKARFDVNNVEDMNINPSTLENTKKSLRIENHARTVQPTLNFIKTAVTANNAHLPEQRQASTHKKQKLSEKDRFEDRVKNNRTSILSKKSLSKKDKRQYSLPRRPVKEPLKGGHCVTFVEESAASFAVADVSVEPIQQSATAVDTSFRRPQKLASKKHLPQQKSNPNINERQPVGQKHANVRRPDLSVNETMVVPKKGPRKRKLLEELDKAEGSSTRRINEDEGQHVIERSEDGRTRKASYLSAFDVILQAVTDTENKLLTEAEDDAPRHRLVRKVMGSLKKKIKPLISDVEELKDLQHEIRQKNSKISKLSTEIKQQKQLRAQLYKEIHHGIGVDRDLDLINVIDTMKGYAQLMQTFTNKSK